jgi:hypothetical protein
MKNIEVIRAAERVLAFAKSQGLTSSALEFMDENGDIYESLDDLAENFEGGETLEIYVKVILDKITVEIIQDEDAEDLEVRISEE